MAHTLDTLGWSAVCRGDYQAAEAHYRESLELFERIGDQAGIAHASGGIGWVAWCVGGDRLQEAREQIERSLAGMRQRGQRLWIANFIGDMGMIAIDSGDYAHAWACAQEGLAIAREIDSGIYITYHLNILGHIAAARQEFEASRRYLGEVLRIASEARMYSRLTFVVYDLALALTREAAHLGPTHPAYSALRTRAVELIASIVDHPAIWYVCRVRAGDLLEELRRELAPDLVEAAIARGRQVDWEAGVTPLLDELANPVSAFGFEIGD
jgi:tetratricopeptide (TPR) repeat protein